jgi:Uma2 family endonuclease
MSLTKTKHLTEAEYREFALGDPQGQWELLHGELREKPRMSVEHGGAMVSLVKQLMQQLDLGVHTLRINHARLRRSADTYYVPDIAVIPTTLEQALLARPKSLDAYAEPLPLVIEIWSPSTGDYDVTAKLPDYQRRGDQEIWYVHPYERTLKVWSRNSDGSYAESTHYGGVVRPRSLPGVAIDLDALFGR